MVFSDGSSKQGNNVTKAIMLEETLYDRYELGKELGKGRFGVVRECRDKATGKQMACKSVCKADFKSKSEMKDLRAEISIMRNLQDHDHIVSLHEVFEEVKYTHLVMDFCPAGDLFDYISEKKRLSERDAAVIIRQLATAVQYCHEKGVIHRDLKPENILFQQVPTKGSPGSFHAKLADFGLATNFSPPLKAVGMAGSPFYMAPEVIKRKPYGPEVDVWSMGVILYAVLSGCLPFWGVNQEHTFAAICHGYPDYERRAWRSISSEAKALVRRMLSVDGKKRISVKGLIEHPWIKSHTAEASSSASASAVSPSPPRLLKEISPRYFGVEAEKKAEDSGQKQSTSATPGQQKDRFGFKTFRRRLLSALLESRAKGAPAEASGSSRTAETCPISVRLEPLKLAEEEKMEKDCSSQQSTPRTDTTLWSFPGEMSSRNSSGISPQSSVVAVALQL